MLGTVWWHLMRLIQSISELSLILQEKKMNLGDYFCDALIGG